LNYKAVNTDFGTLEDLRVLVEEAHKKKMAGYQQTGLPTILLG
jgi:hypothetical protein